MFAARSTVFKSASMNKDDSPTTMPRGEYFNLGASGMNSHFYSKEKVDDAAFALAE